MSSVSTKIEQILKSAQPAIRDELAKHLSACGFTDPDDPLLNSLVAEAMIVGQPVRLVETGGAAVATEAGLARLGDRFDDITWSLLNLKIRNVLVGCLLSVAIGAGCVLLALTLWPEPLAHFFRLRPAVDRRIETLAASGAALRVEQKKGITYVYLTGTSQWQAGHSREGLNYLYFQP